MGNSLQLTRGVHRAKRETKEASVGRCCICGWKSRSHWFKSSTAYSMSFKCFGLASVGPLAFLGLR
jgi:hypothetical protein